jgi:phage/plasmid-associated DNA primase
MTEYEICKVPTYKVNYENSKKITKPINALCEYLQQDFQAHERLNKDDMLKLALDVDKIAEHNPSATFEKILNDICDYLSVNSTEVSYTQNVHKITGSYHVVIPKFHMKSSDQKMFWKQFREKYRYGKEIDIDIFDKSGWFRLPNQTKEGVVGTEHIVQTGKLEDFVLKYVENSELYPFFSPIISMAETIKKPYECKKKVVVEENADDTDKETEDETSSLTQNQELLRMITIDKKDRTTWLRVCSCLKYNGMSNGDWEKFCKDNQLNYDTEKKDLFKNIKTDYGLEVHYLKSLAKKSNPIEYKKWVEKWNVYFIQTDDIEDPYKSAVVISKTLSDKLKLCKESWYMLTEMQLWKQQKEPSFYIINELRKYIDESNKKIVYRISQSSGEEKEKLIETSKKYLQSYKKISSSGYLNVLTKYLKTLLTDDTFADKLDNNKGKLAFKNGVMDLQTKKFKDCIEWCDFITETIPYDYTPSGYDNVKSVLKKILNNDDDHLEYYLSIIGYSFIGEPNLEKSLYFMIDKTGLGKGDNGKTFFFDILTTLMPNYTYKSKSSFLEKTNTKVHKQLALMKGKRLVWLDEMPKEKNTNAELMKELADGNQVENEVMFGTSETINIMFKLFGLSNHVPKIDPNETAVYNRYKQVSFNSHFDRTGNREKDCPEELKFIADPTLSTTIKEIYYNEVFNMVIDYGHKYYQRKLPAIPQQFVADTKETQHKNDEFGLWFEENCVVNETERVALKAIVSLSGMGEKLVKEGMERKGFKYEKDLCKLGKDQYGKHYKGGYKGVMLTENEEDEDE